MWKPRTGSDILAREGEIAIAITKEAIIIVIVMELEEKLARCLLLLRVMGEKELLLLLGTGGIKEIVRREGGEGDEEAETDTRTKETAW